MPAWAAPGPRGGGVRALPHVPGATGKFLIFRAVFFFGQNPIEKPIVPALGPSLSHPEEGSPKGVPAWAPLGPPPGVLKGSLVGGGFSIEGPMGRDGKNFFEFFFHFEKNFQF